MSIFKLLITLIQTFYKHLGALYLILSNPYDPITSKSWASFSFYHTCLFQFCKTIFYTSLTNAYYFRSFFCGYIFIKSNSRTTLLPSKCSLNLSDVSPKFSLLYSEASPKFFLMVILSLQCHFICLDWVLSFTYIFQALVKPLF